MCEACREKQIPENDSKFQKAKRVWLWDFTDNVHCPLIGTCLNNQDLLNLTRRLKLTVSPDCRDYDLHGYFVGATTTKSPEAKAIHKLLDDRYSGALRKFKRLNSDDEILSVWNDMKDSGQIAAAFYATMTLSHVSEEVRGQIFGEVHMLSHLMGASFRAQSVEVAVLKSRLDDIQSRRSRVEKGLHEALQERDERIAELEKQANAWRAKAHSTKRVELDWKDRAKADKRSRAIEIARAKARAAETDLERSKERLVEYRKRILQLQRRPVAAVGSVRSKKAVPKLDGQSFLYVGGRPSQISHLEKTVDFFGAKFIHHDGGKEDAITRIDDVLSSVDCVFCPVDCVSHDACLRVKSRCKKLGKTFIPLRSSSQTTLKQALLSLDRSTHV